MNDLAIPAGALSLSGCEAWQAIMGLVERFDLWHTGGCRVFYSPDEWVARGEPYGTTSELIVVYDGAAIRELFEGRLSSSTTSALEELGLYYEQCTHWYSAIYHIPKGLKNAANTL